MTELAKTHATIQWGRRVHDWAKNGLCAHLSLAWFADMQGQPQTTDMELVTAVFDITDLEDDTTHIWHVWIECTNPDGQPLVISPALLLQGSPMPLICDRDSYYQKNRIVDGTVQRFDRPAVNRCWRGDASPRTAGRRFMKMAKMADVEAQWMRRKSVA